MAEANPEHFFTVKSGGCVYTLYAEQPSAEQIEKRKTKPKPTKTQRKIFKMRAKMLAFMLYIHQILENDVDMTWDMEYLDTGFKITIAITQTHEHLEEFGLGTSYLVEPEKHNIYLKYWDIVKDVSAIVETLNALMQTTNQAQPDTK